MNITITDKAAQEIIKQADNRGRSSILRIGIRAGGCHGFSYEVVWAEGSPEENDEVFQNGEAVVYIDKKSLIYLNGSTLDFETSIMGRGFKIDSPLSKGTCGCGESVEF